MDIKNYIEVFDAVIPYPTLANLIKFVNTKNFEKAEVIGTSGHEVNMSIRNTFNISIDINSESMTDVHWLNLLTLIFKTHMRKYTEKVSGDPNKIFVSKIIDIQLLKSVGELCDKANLEKETLILEKANLENIDNSKINY